MKIITYICLTVTINKIQIPDFNIRSRVKNSIRCVRKLLPRRCEVHFAIHSSSLKPLEEPSVSTKVCEMLTGTMVTINQTVKWCNPKVTSTQMMTGPYASALNNSAKRWKTSKGACLRSLYIIITTRPSPFPSPLPITSLFKYLAAVQHFVQYWKRHHFSRRLTFQCTVKHIPDTAIGNSIVEVVVVFISQTILFIILSLNWNLQIIIFECISIEIVLTNTSNQLLNCCKSALDNIRSNYYLETLTLYPMFIFWYFWLNLSRPTSLCWWWN